MEEIGAPSKRNKVRGGSLGIAVLLVLATLAAAALVVPVGEADARRDPAKTGFNSACVLSHTSLDDPIVEPEPGMGHEHKFFGNSGTDQASTGETLRDNGMLHTCSRAAQRSAYWVPTMRLGEDVIEPTRMGVYYLTGDGLSHARVDNIPFGLEAIARQAGAPGKVEWYCNKRAQDGPRRDSPPPTCKNPGQGLGVTITFPPCLNPDSPGTKNGWDLVDPVGGGGPGRKCPDHHPRQLPTLVLHVDYPVLPDKTGPVTVAHHEGWMGADHMHADYVNPENVNPLIHDCMVKRNPGDKRPKRCEQ